MRDCGGCKGLGSHVRFCRAVSGIMAERSYLQSQEAGDLADEVSSNYPEVANLLYQAAALLRTQAVQKEQAFKEVR